MDYIIILAGGKGLRMGAEVPKQFLPIGGKPILMRTIERFRAYSASLHVILVLPAAQHEYWHRLCREYGFSVDYDVTTGGPTRFHSIKNGLALIPDDAQGVVGVHDGVRPFPSVEVIANCYATARRCGTAVPVVKVVETVRRLTSAGSESVQQSVTVPRDEYRLVQTPQMFDIQLHKRAYAQPYTEAFTDDASVVEALGHAITLVEGNRENIKITTPFDMVVAEALAVAASQPADCHAESPSVTGERKEGAC